MIAHLAAFLAYRLINAALDVIAQAARPTDDLRHMPIAQAAEVAALREMWARNGETK